MGWGRIGSRGRRRENGEKESLPGCMNGFLQLFRFHRRLFRATAANAGDDGDEDFSPALREPTSPKGLVAPRNSLKLDEALSASTSTVQIEEDEYNEISMGVAIILKKNKDNVVARLMGLDHVPYQPPSPKLSRQLAAATPPPLRISNTWQQDNTPRHGTRSLPATPRSSFNDPRLSLQLPLKENFFFPREDSSPSPRLSKLSPRQYASDIVKQVFRKTKKRDRILPKLHQNKSKKPMEKIKKMSPVRAPPPLEIESPPPPPPTPPPPSSSENEPSFSKEEYLYVKCILDRTRLGSGSLKWYSPAHPLDPIIFHQLERTFRRSAGKLSLRCNRKLLFNLADEILGEILREERRRRSAIETAEQRLWRRLRGGGAGADVAALVAADMVKWDDRPALGRAAESAAAELGSFLLDSLLSETVVLFTT